MRNAALCSLIILAVFCWTGAACLDQFTGAPTVVENPDGTKTVVPGSANPPAKIVAQAVESGVPGIGWLIGLGITVFGTIYNGVRASQAKTDKLTLQTAWQALKDNWDNIQSLKDLEVLIDNAAPNSAIAKRISEEIDTLKAKGVI